MLQGSRQAHVKAIESAAEKAGVQVNIREVRTPGDLMEPKLHAMILPGGESTTMRKVGGKAGTGVLGEIFKMLRHWPDLPVLATCAGTILLADPQDEAHQSSKPLSIGTPGGDKLTHSWRVFQFEVRSSRPSAHSSGPLGSRKSPQGSPSLPSRVRPSE